jgi:hypothetical protein
MPAASQSFLHKKQPVHHKRSSLVHTQATFLYHGQSLGPVENAQAVLYDASLNDASDTVLAINSASHSVLAASRACQAFVPGRQLTVGPGGELYFDYVESGNYSIMVCAQVHFQGVKNPVWVSGTIPITKAEFSEAHSGQYDLPHPIEIELAPYAAELKAEPGELPSLVAAR